MEKIAVCFMLFITYSFIGWIIEIVNEIIVNKKLINRGFLIGPYCPIYGFGSIIMIYCISNTSDVLGTFLKIIVICALLEYITSYIMEKLFKTRWWDYSYSKFNLNGRICLETMILFGIGGCILLYIINPFIVEIYSSIPNILLYILSIILFIILITDVILSFNIINSFKNTVILKKDSTEEISKKVRNNLKNRLIKAFPDIEKLKKK